MTTTEANLNLGFDNIQISQDNATMMFQAEIFAQPRRKLAYRPNFAHISAKFQPPARTKGTIGNQEMLETSLEAPNILRIRRRVQRNDFKAVKDHTCLARFVRVKILLDFFP